MASKRFRDAVGIDPDRIVSAAVDAALGENRSRGKRHHPGRVLAAGAAVAAAAAVGQRRLPRLAKVPLRMGLHKLGDMAHVDELADAVRDRLMGHEDEPDDEEYYDDEEDLDDEDFDDEDFDDEEEFEDEPRDEADDDPDDEDEGFDDEDDEGFDDDPEDGDGPRGEGDEEPEEFEDDSDDPGPEDEAPEDDDEDLEADEEDFEPEDDEDLEPEDEEDEEDVEPEEDDEQIAARTLELGLARNAHGRRARDRAPDLFEALRTPHRRAPVMRRGSLRVDPATRPPEPDESQPRNERRDRSRKPKSKAARA